MARNRPGNGPHSRLLERGCIDGRSRNGRFLAAARHELSGHLGSELSPIQRMLVERCAWLMLHVALFDERVAETGRPLSDRDRRSYLAFSNSLVRTSRQLGLPPSAFIADVLRGAEDAA